MQTLEEQLRVVSDQDLAAISTAWKRPPSFWIARHFNPKSGKRTQKWTLALPKLKAAPFGSMTEAYNTLTKALCLETARRSGQLS